MSVNDTENWINSNGAKDENGLTVKSTKSSEQLDQGYHGQGHHSEGDALNSIREILFGQQTRQHENRFVTLEKQLIKTIDQLKNDLNQRLDTIETRLEEQLNSLTQQLTDEQATRQDDLQKLKATVDDQTNSLRDDFNQSIADITQKLDQESLDRQQSDQTQKVKLAKVFQDISQQLNVDL